MPSTWIMFLNSWLTHDKLLESRASRVRHLKLVDHKTELLKDAIKINPFNVLKSKCIEDLMDRIILWIKTFCCRIF